MSPQFPSVSKAAGSDRLAARTARSTERRNARRVDLQRSQSLPSQAQRSQAQTSEAQRVVVSGGETAALQALSTERQELLCSLIGLAVKVGLVVVAGVSLARLASAYQERMERQGELAAVLDLERAKLSKARDRFDHLFVVEGEQRLIREQNQWIAPNRLRVVWQNPELSQPTP